MTEVLKTLLMMSVSGSVLGLLLLIGRRISGKRLPSTLWYYVWIPVMLRLMLPLPGIIPVAADVALTAPAPVIESGIVGQQGYDMAGLQDDMSYKDKASFGNEYNTVKNHNEESLKTGSSDSLAYDSSEATAATKKASSAEYFLQAKRILESPILWIIIWLAGVAIFFLRYLLGYTKFRHALISTIKPVDEATAQAFATINEGNLPEIYISSKVKTPMLIGVLRPMIILPESEYSVESKLNILRHELTHYHARDLLIKWVFTFVASIHWFNPLMRLFRKEINSVCELSCDEKVLTKMEPSRRYSYGETLLDLAENRVLPVGVVASTFAAEKRVLKERLEQIMKFKHKPKTIFLSTIVALLVVTMVAWGAAPAKAETGPAGEVVECSTVDEFLGAIKPDTTIVLKPGVYDVHTKTIEDSEYFHYDEANVRYVIENVENLSIVAESDDVTATRVWTGSEFSNVLTFVNCKNINMSGFTGGYPPASGEHNGFVFAFEGTSGVTIENCVINGNSEGILASFSENIKVSETEFNGLSNAFLLWSDKYVQIDSCTFHDCIDNKGTKTDKTLDIFEIHGCYGVCVNDSHIFGNNAEEYLAASSSKDIYLLGTLFENNNLPTAGESGDSASDIIVKSENGAPVTIAGCEFRDSFDILGGSESAVDMDGKALSEDELRAMKQEKIDFNGFEKTSTSKEIKEVHVSTVNELLEAIAPNTKIYLSEGLYKLSDAEGYGTSRGEYYYWVQEPDGVGLVISGADNISIIGEGKDSVSIETDPRYADVIRFEYSKNTTVQGMTIGHTFGAGSCKGDVLRYVYCENIDVKDCGLFGCGVIGISADNCKNINAEGNEIYSCSQGAVDLWYCENAVFDNNDIHDCAYPTYQCFDSANILVDGYNMLEEVGEDGENGWKSTDSDGKTHFFTHLNIDGAGPYKKMPNQG